MESLKLRRLFALITAIFAITLYAPTLYAAGFDVDESNPNYDAIMYLMDKGIVEGYIDGTVKPDQEITRAELLKIFVKSSTGVPETFEYNRCFADVEILEWYIRYVCYAKSVGWVEGYGDDTFKPDDPINNVETLAMLFRTQGFYPPKSAEINEDPFMDVSSDAWYEPYVWYAKDKGIIDNDSDYYNPGKLVTRGEAFEMLYRTLLMKEELSKPVVYSDENVTFTHSGFYTQMENDPNLGGELYDTVTLFTNENDDGIAFMEESQVQLLEDEIEMTLEELLTGMEDGIITDDIAVKSGKIVNIGNYNEYFDSYAEGAGTFLFKVEPIFGSGDATYVIAHYSDEKTRDELIAMFKTITVK